VAAKESPDEASTEGVGGGAGRGVEEEEKKATRRGVKKEKKEGGEKRNEELIFYGPLTPCCIAGAVRSTAGNKEYFAAPRLSKTSLSLYTPRPDSPLRGVLILRVSFLPPEYISTGN